ncbi:MAG: hypothetical protein J1E34_06735 [Oscillospiraceae bacterium]|nr:hypothetical protein [Oscillospiraceae bacterium]
MKTYEETAFIIEQKLNAEKTKRKKIKKGAGVLTALLLMIGAAITLRVISNTPTVTPNTETTEPTPSQTEESEPLVSQSEENKHLGIYLTPAPLPEKSDGTAMNSVVPFVVYNGKIYCAEGCYYYNASDWKKIPKKAKETIAYMSEDIADTKKSWYSPDLLSDAQWDALIGEQLGVAKGSVDCLNIIEKNEEGYDEFDGTVEGPIYAVNGYSTDDVLCFVQTFTVLGFYDTYKIPGGYRKLVFLRALDGFSVETGADFFKNHLHTDNTVAYKYVSDYEWQYGHTNLSFNNKNLNENAKKEIPLSSETMNAFMEELYSSPAVLDAVDFTGEEISGHLYLQQANGTYENLRLFEGGYVYCTSFSPDKNSSHRLFIAMNPDGVFKTVWDSINADSE